MGTTTVRTTTTKTKITTKIRTITARSRTAILAMVLILVPTPEQEPVLVILERELEVTRAVVAAPVSCRATFRAPAVRKELLIQPKASPTHFSKHFDMTLTIASKQSRDSANFINFCSGKTITNGTQAKGGSCNGVGMLHRSKAKPHANSRSHGRHPGHG